MIVFFSFQVTEDVDAVGIFSHDLNAVDALVEVGDLEGLVVVLLDAVRLQTMSTVAAEVAVDAVEEPAASRRQSIMCKSV